MSGEGNYQSVDNEDFDVPYDADGDADAQYNDDDDDLVDYDDDSRQKFEHSDKFKDWPFAGGFLAQLFAVVVASVFLTSRTYEAADSTQGSFGFEQRIEIMEMVTVSCLIALILSVVWMLAFQLFGTSSLVFVLFGAIAMSLIVCVVLVFLGQLALALVMFVVMALAFHYTVTTRRNMAFSGAIVKLVVKLLSEVSLTLSISLGMALVQACWLGVWSCLMVDLHLKGHVFSSLEMFGMALSLLWTTQVMKNVVHMTTAGAVATWYFLHETGMPLNVTLTSFKHAMTTSFGSVCLGATLVSPCRCFRTIVDKGRLSDSVLASCFAAPLEKVSNYFNIFAFTQVAIYGQPFLSSGTHVWELIRARGVDLTTSQNHIGGSAFSACYISGALTSLCGGLWAFQFDNMSVSFVAALCFMIGFSITSTVVEVVWSASTALLVCYADDPEVLSRTDPVTFSMIREACSSTSFL